MTAVSCGKSGLLMVLQISGGFAGFVYGHEYLKAEKQLKKNHKAELVKQQKIVEEQQRKKEQEEKQALIDQIEQLKDLILAMQGVPKPPKQVAVESPKTAKKRARFC